MYECRKLGCQTKVPTTQATQGPEFFCRTAGMNEHFRARDDGTLALVPDECSPGCRCLDDGEFFHDAACAGRLAARERTRPEPTHHWDEWWRSFLEHVAWHGVGYGGSY